jgi:hypothetical protein
MFEEGELVKLHISGSLNSSAIDAELVGGAHALALRHNWPLTIELVLELSGTAVLQLGF